MARSLTIKHEEKPTTSSLLNLFLLLAVGWMAVTALVASTADASPAPPAAVVSPTP